MGGVIGADVVINRSISAGSPRGNHLIFCPSVKRLEMGEGVIRERERERETDTPKTNAQLFRSRR